MPDRFPILLSRQELAMAQVAPKLLRATTEFLTATTPDELDNSQRLMQEAVQDIVEDWMSTEYIGTLQ